MLYFQNLTPWDPTQRIDGIRYGWDIANWPPSDLASIGLFAPLPHENIPDGKRSGTAVEWDGECARYVLEDILPDPIPGQVSAAQAKLALDAVGMLDDVEAMIAAHPVRAVRIWFADANVWERSHPYLSALGAEMSLDDDAIDALFAAASLY